MDHKDNPGAKKKPHKVKPKRPTPAEHMEKQIRAAEEDAKQHYDKLLRVMAEFENFKKRMQKETAERLQFSTEKLLADLLPVLDDLDRVLDHIPDKGSKEVHSIAEGVKLVQKNMLAALGKHGLKEVSALGHTFDPNVHEAISTSQDEKSKPDTVITVHRKGYTMHDRLLRAAMVTVNKGE
jgi:molecular chaperone GrpE